MAKRPFRSPHHTITEAGGSDWRRQYADGAIAKLAESGFYLLASVKQHSFKMVLRLGTIEFYLSSNHN